MKRYIALILVALLVCMSFAGCTLENQRNAHLKYDSDGNIQLNGQTYIALHENTNMLDPEMDYETEYYVTEADVPLLLKDMLGVSSYASKDGKILEVGPDYYCRSDVYAEVAELLRNPGKLEYFCYTPLYTAGETNLVSLEDSRWVMELLETLEPVEDESQLDSAVYYTPVYACNQDMLLRTNAFEIYRSGMSYYVYKPLTDLEGDDFYAYHYVYYHIPAEDAPRFHAIFADKLSELK